MKSCCHGCSDEFARDDCAVVIDGYEYCRMCAEIEASRPERDGSIEAPSDNPKAQGGRQPNRFKGKERSDGR